ncbi:hypothetical protein TNCV_3253851 [Trichonephila clavipes]|nr:hypothetical protein TNCV_3253851 [Trichonephila clavipes]
MLRRKYTSDDPGDPPMGVDRRESVSLYEPTMDFFDVDDSERKVGSWCGNMPSKQIVAVDPKSFDKLLATEYGCYSFFAIKDK